MILTLLFALDSLVSLAQATVGPSATLNVANQVIAPDGFQRSWVKFVPSKILSPHNAVELFLLMGYTRRH